MTAAARMLAGERFRRLFFPRDWAASEIEAIRGLLTALMASIEGARP